MHDQREDEGTLQDMIRLLRNWVFMMFAVSNFLTSLGYPIPYSFVPVSLSWTMHCKLQDGLLLAYRIMRYRSGLRDPRAVSLWV